MPLRADPLLPPLGGGRLEYGIETPGHDILECKVLGRRRTLREETDFLKALEFDENGETKCFKEVELT